MLSSEVSAVRYKANRGGHAPEHLRDWFWRYIEAGQAIKDDLREEMVESITHHRLELRRKSLEEWLLGQLWDCRDVMPSDGRTQIMDIMGGEREYFTYGQAVRALKTLQKGAR